MWAESQVYGAQKFLPNEDIERRIEALHVELRRIGNNFNQLAKTGNIFGRLFGGGLSRSLRSHVPQRRPGAVMKQVEALEKTVAAFIRRPWGRPPKAPDQAPPSNEADSR